MPSPTEQIFQETAKDFSIRWNFPNCIESIGGKHIKVEALCHQHSTQEQQ